MALCSKSPLPERFAEKDPQRRGVEEPGEPGELRHWSMEVWAGLGHLVPGTFSLESKLFLKKKKYRQHYVTPGMRASSFPYLEACLDKLKLVLGVAREELL